MNILIDKMKPEDKTEIIQMMKEFYSSDAVSTNGSREIFEFDFETCINPSSLLEGFVFKDGENVLGYAMTARSFSTEFGKECIWLEDLYVKPDYRRKGIISDFLKFIEQLHPACVFKLEAEAGNIAAIEAYKKNGFIKLQYTEMIKNAQ